MFPKDTEKRLEERPRRRLRRRLARGEPFDKILAGKILDGREPFRYVFLNDLSDIFVFAFVTGLSGALIPGPLLTFSIHAAARRGAHTGFLVVIGHAILEITIVVAIFAGASRFLANQTALRVVAGIGAAALGAMSVMMIRQVPKLSLSEIIASEKPVSKVENPILGGFLFSLVNPSFPLWWIGVGLSLTARVDPTPGNIAVFYGGHLSSDFAWYVFVSCVVGFGRKHIPDRAYRVLILLLAVMLIRYAYHFAWSAATGVRA